MLLAAGASLLPAARPVPQEVGQDPLAVLLGTPVTVASRKALALRQSPGIVTVLDESDIQASGARDLVDLLALVPGFYPALDVTGVVGVGVRGLWGYEGKILFLLDGLELNETLYGNVELLAHYPILNLKRVEIIRGPGSALHGGFAELAVVNLITYSGSDLMGTTELRAATSRMGSRTGRSEVEFMGGGPTSNGHWSLGGRLGQALETDQVFRDSAGNSADLGLSQKVRNVHVNVAWRDARTDVRLLVDRYTIQDRTRFGTLTPPRDAGFDDYQLQATRQLPLREGLDLALSATYRWQKPWDTSVSTFMERATLAGTLNWEIGGTANLQAGFRTLRDSGRLEASATPADWFQGGTTPRLNLDNHSLFAQLLWPTSLGTLTAGARYEWTSSRSRAFVPRFAFTRVFERFHLKLLLTEAFRSPILGNFAYNRDLGPERLRAVELEGGLRVGGGGLLTVNVYRQTLRDLIVYRADPATGIQTYTNYPSLASDGLEADYHHRFPWGHLDVNGSHTRARGLVVDVFRAAGSGGFVAVPRNHLSARVAMNLGAGWTLGPTVVWMAAREGFGSSASAGTTVPARAPAALLANLQVRWDGRTRRGRGPFLDLVLRDLGQARPPYLQAYDGGHPGIPGPSRESILRIGWGL